MDASRLIAVRHYDTHKARNHRMEVEMKIYTKQGDEGYTSLYDGTRVGKDHPRIVATGDVDETNSAVGLAIVDCKHRILTDVLLKLQHQLFAPGDDLATPLFSPNTAKIDRIDESHIAYLEPPNRRRRRSPSPS